MQPLDPPPPGTPAGFPYGAPSAAPFVPRPTTTSVPKVFGILSIIFGSLGLLSGMMQGCSGLVGQMVGGLKNLPASRGQSQEEMQQMMEMLGDMYSGIGIQGLIMLVVSAFLLTVGIGQLKYRRWGQKWSVIWGAGAIAAALLMVVVSLTIIAPAYERFFDFMMKSAAKAGPGAPQLPTGLFGSIIGGSSVIGILLFYLPYPILILAFFTRPHVKAAMDK